MSIIPFSRINHTTYIACTKDHTNHQWRQQRCRGNQLLNSVLGNVFFWKPILWGYQAPSGQAIWQAENTDSCTCAQAQDVCLGLFVCACSGGHLSPSFPPAGLITNKHRQEIDALSRFLPLPRPAPRLWNRGIAKKQTNKSYIIKTREMSK